MILSQILTALQYAHVKQFFFAFSLSHSQITRKNIRDDHIINAETALRGMDYLSVLQNMVGFDTLWNHCDVLFNVIP